MHVESPGINLIKEFEGFHEAPYWDPVGIPTIGYGIIKYPNGVRVAMADDPITEDMATAFLIDHINKHVIPDIKKLTNVPLNQNQVDALVSWVYNLGSTNFRTSTMLKRINEGRHEDAANEMLKWVYAGGKKLRGLERRREAERALYLEPCNGKLPLD